VNVQVRGGGMGRGFNGCDTFGAGFGKVGHAETARGD
jgi:hypothetical protein